MEPSMDILLYGEKIREVTGLVNVHRCKIAVSTNQMQFTETFCDRLTGGKDGVEISGIAYDTNSGQIAVVHRAEAIHRFILDVGMIPRVIKSVTIVNHWPQGVAFGHVGVRGPELWSFGREDGAM